MTFKGAVVGCPITAGARGRARCRKEGVATAMLGNMWSRNEERRREAEVEVEDVDVVRAKFPFQFPPPKVLANLCGLGLDTTGATDCALDYGGAR